MTAQTKSARWWGWMALLGALACTPKTTFESPPNAPPETFLFLRTPVTDTVPARVVMSWYGNDPDGEVVAYRYSWWRDTVQVMAGTTQVTQDTFTLPVAGAVRVYTFRIQAIDDQGVADPTPATVSFPMVNSPPTIAFTYQSLPPETTLNIVTFFFEVHDMDGDNTITQLLYRLDTDTAWTVTSFDSTYLTLENIPPGTRTVYFRAADFTGALSDSIAYTWTVRPVRGSLLVILDHDAAHRTDWTDMMIQAGYDTTAFTFWYLPNELTDPDRFPEVVRDIRALLTPSRFRAVFWLSAAPNPADVWLNHLLVPLQDYVQAGGQVFFSGPAFAQDVDTAFLKTYLGLASTDTSVYKQDKLIAQFGEPRLARDSLAPVGLPDTLVLSAGTPLLSRVDGMVSGSFTVLYRARFGLSSSALTDWIPVGVRKGSVVALMLPLLGVNGNGLAPQVLSEVGRWFGVYTGP